MKQLFRRGAVVGALSLAVVAAGCKTELTVPNRNNPDLVKVLSSGADVQSVIGNAFATWWNSEQDVNRLAMTVTADSATANFGNFGMRFNSQEPRLPYNNNSSSGYDAGNGAPSVDVELLGARLGE